MTRKRFAGLGAFLIAHCIALCVALCGMSVITATPVYADTTILVDTFADAIDANGNCSLREAIIAANTNLSVDGCAAGSGDDTIVLTAGVYQLTIPGRGEQAALTGDLDITVPEGLMIQGAGIVTTTIDAGGIDRAFAVFEQLARVTIADLTIQNGRVLTGEGSGGIHNIGILTLTHTIVQSNTVEGINSDDIGGGICNGCATGTGILTIIDSVIRNNTAERGGGIFSNTTLTITHSSILSNRARAGGGLMNYGGAEDTAMLSNSTISGNVAGGNSGGISQNGGTLTLINSTIATNTANSWGGIGNIEGTTSARNTIFADNAGGNCSEPGMLTSNGHNLSSDATCSFSATGDLNNVDARLGPLATYGGPTPMHSISFLSPARNAGSNSLCPSTDQRGVARPQASTCDIGAYEYNDVPLTLNFPLIRK